MPWYLSTNTIIRWRSMATTNMTTTELATTNMTTTRKRPSTDKAAPKRTSRKGPPPLTAQDVLAALEGEYAPFPWEARYDAISEVVFTILSQHTSDRNSERAFARLMEHFDSFEALAQGDVEVIEERISIGGLARKSRPHALSRSSI